MAVRSRRDLSPHAFQLAARLETYEADVEALMAQARFDAERCRLLTGELEEVGRLSGALPQLAVDVMEMTFQHFELMRSLCRAEAAAVRAAPEGAAALLRRQRRVVRAARQKCVKLIARD